MSGNRLLILSIVFAILIIGGAVAFSAVRTINGQGNSDPELGVLMPPSMSQCIDHCIMVERKCSLCCDYVAIAAKSESSFNQMYDATCSHYRGPTQTPQIPNAVPQCVQGKCQMIAMGNK